MIVVLVSFAAAVAQPMLPVSLQPLGFLIGHCWRSEGAGGVTDTHCYEAIYGGRHIRDVHVVRGRDGTATYRGETLYSAIGGKVSYTYWNSDGGVATGTMRMSGPKFDFSDGVYADPGGKRIPVPAIWQRTGVDSYEAANGPEGARRTVRFVRVR